MRVEYINTDLDLISAHDIDPLVKAFERAGMLVLHVDRRDEKDWLACIESGRQHRRPDRSIADLLRVVERLEGDELRLWRGCKARVFNVGYQSGTAPRSVEHHLSPVLLRRIADAGASIGLTIYAVDED